MDEGDGEVEIDEIGTDEGCAVEDADWDDGAKVDAPGHADLMAGVQQAGEASQGLCQDGRKDQVP